MKKSEINKEFRKIAKKVGFVFWKKNESKDYTEKEIDWSSDYGEEFNKYSKKLIKNALSAAKKKAKKDK